MLYERTVLQELSELLTGFHNDLRNEAENLDAAAKKLAQSWDGNKALDAFQASKNKWDQQFGKLDDNDPATAMGKVQALSQAVDAAMRNATAADTKVTGGFGG
ncbi:MAG: hypothetical protein J2P18_08865 [Nocardia sp.]|nr:hypothetical protein [Nocardia sp.]